MADDIHLGTSSFTAKGWEETFYPRGMKPAEYLGFYSRQYDTVEVDSTFYRTPSAATVKRWYAQTPSEFLFALKVVQTVTHEKVLVDCVEELREFLDAAALLRGKLGPLLFQFPYFNRQAFASGASFLDRLEPFLEKLPESFRYAVEIRNKQWLVPRLADVLRKKKAALALIDHPWMPRPAEVFQRIDPFTADFTYIRFLGDRKAIEEKTKTWDKVIVPREKDLMEWVPVVRRAHQRRIQIFAYANNHYAGHAPATLREFAKMLEK
ncbi:MAG TPA: DUF72 domain-containing protein [Verrucomicrobiae bacterium]|nr:DUF72 domain-containing protein [Verrucomicrobiae bacterium]